MAQNKAGFYVLCEDRDVFFKLEVGGRKVVAKQQGAARKFVEFTANI